MRGARAVPGCAVDGRDRWPGENVRRSGLGGEGDTCRSARESDESGQSVETGGGDLQDPGARSVWSETIDRVPTAAPAVGGVAGDPIDFSGLWEGFRAQ